MLTPAKGHVGPHHLPYLCDPLPSSQMLSWTVLTDPWQKWFVLQSYCCFQTQSVAFSTHRPIKTFGTCLACPLPFVCNLISCHSSTAEILSIGPFIAIQAVALRDSRQLFGLLAVHTSLPPSHHSSHFCLYSPHIQSWLCHKIGLHFCYCKAIRVTKITE